MVRYFGIYEAQNKCSEPLADIAISYVEALQQSIAQKEPIEIK